MFDVPDRVIICHHLLGKIRLHTRSVAEAYMRVTWRETAVPPLQIVSRQYGTTWNANAVKVPPNFITALQKFLAQRRDTGPYYLYESETSAVLERFRKAQT